MAVLLGVLAFGGHAAAQDTPAEPRPETAAPADPPPAKPARTPVFGVVNQVGPRFPEPVQDAFNAALGGLKEASPGELVIESLDGDAKRWDKVNGRLSKRSPDAWLAVGPLALKLLAAATVDQPVLFMMVATPEDSLPGGAPPNVAGVTLRLAADDQLREIKSFLPKASKVGVLYDPANSRSKRELDKAREASSSVGLEIVARAMSDEGELGAAVRELLEQGIDVMWLIGDKKVTPPGDQRAFKFIVEKSAAKGVPVVGHARRQTASGALFSLGPDLKDIGAQAGELVARLGADVRPSDIGIVSPRKISLTVNQKVARSLGIELPPGALARAESVD